MPTPKQAATSTPCGAWRHEADKPATVTALPASSRITDSSVGVITLLLTRPSCGSVKADTSTVRPSRIRVSQGCGLRCRSSRNRWDAVTSQNIELNLSQVGTSSPTGWPVKNTTPRTKDRMAMNA